VAEVLGSIGYSALIAHDGEAALSEVQRSMPDVVIVDLELPVIDGLEVARRLREAYGNRMRLIANTASPDTAETHTKTADAAIATRCRALWLAAKMVGLHPHTALPTAHCVFAAKPLHVPQHANHAIECPSRDSSCGGTAKRAQDW